MSILNEGGDMMEEEEAICGSKDVKQRGIEVVLKTSDICTNKCRYCFYFGVKDRNFGNDNKIISHDSIIKIAQFLKTGCKLLERNALNIIIHGGEPLLQPMQDFDYMCKYLQDTLNDTVKLSFGLQTNGTLITKEWIKIFNKYKIVPSISIDGYREVHDKFRVDHCGGGTYEKVVNAITLLQADGNEALKGLGTLTVVNPTYSAKKIYRHFVDDLMLRKMDFLLPDINYDSLNEDLMMFGASIEDFGNFLCDLFDEWVSDDNPKIRIRLFREILLLFLGNKKSSLDHFGPYQGEKILPVVTIFRDGKLFVEDILASTKKGILNVDMNVNNTTLKELIDSPLFKELREVRRNLPNNCKLCGWAKICNGGATVNRYSNKNGFDNPSVYCSALKRFYAHIASYLTNNGFCAKEDDTTQCSSLILSDQITWFKSNKHRFSIELNGYDNSPIGPYIGTLALIDRSGKILDIGAGNGMQLKFLTTFSYHNLIPYGVEINAKAFNQSINEILPEYSKNFKLIDIKDYDFKEGPFDIILVDNPLIAYPTYDIVEFTKICMKHLSAMGKIIYKIHADALRKYNITDLSVFQNLGMQISSGQKLIFCVLTR